MPSSLPSPGPAGFPDPTRNTAVDVARGIGIVLMIVGHSVEIGFLERPDGAALDAGFAVWQAIYGFHMPLFFFLSGLVVRPDAAEPASRTVARFAHLVLLAVLVHLVGGAVLVATDAAAGTVDPERWRFAILSPLKRGFWFNTVVVWFLVSLAFAQVIARAAWLSGRPVLVIGAAVAVSVAGNAAGLPNWWQFQSWGPGAAFCLLGARSGRLGLPGVVDGAVLLALALLTAALNDGCLSPAADACPMPELGGRSGVLLATGRVGDPFAFAVTALLGVAGVRALGAWIAGRGAAALPLAAVGRSSLVLMVVNGFVLQFLNPTFKGLVPAEPLPLAAAVTALTLCQIAVGLAAAPLFGALDARLRAVCGRLAGAPEDLPRRCA